ncbi:MAG: hypothetical protein AAFW75_08585, partial [Cyanobacteria bacterium J06636_16]
IWPVCSPPIKTLCSKRLAQPSTINHQPSTINHQPSTINHQPSTINQERKVVPFPQGRTKNEEPSVPYLLKPNATHT